MPNASSPVFGAASGGGTFADLADSLAEADTWSGEVAGQRRHGTSFEHPIDVFEQHERAHRWRTMAVPFDVPVWRATAVHVHYHIIQWALYSAPHHRCPPGTHLDVRGNRKLVRLWLLGTDELAIWRNCVEAAAGYGRMGGNPVPTWSIYSDGPLMAASRRDGAGC